MKFILSIALLAGSLQAQTTVYVRASGPASVAISGIRAGNPATITTLSAHGFNVGDVVGVWGVCTGSVGIAPSPVNGIRKVSAVVDSTHFSITDLAGVTINEPNAYVDCGVNVGEPNNAQWTSKLTAYTLGAGPLAWLDGANGVHTRKLALGTANGLTSLVVSGGTATATTSYSHGLVTGDKVSVWGSGNTALNTGNGAGAGYPYPVTALDNNHFMFSVSGVSSGTYSNYNNTCGPPATPNDTIGGTEDCLRISQLAYTGNPLWNSIIASSNLDFTMNSQTNGTGNSIYQMVGDGGDALFSKDNSAVGPYWWGEAAIRLLVDPSNARMLSVVMYALNNPEKVIGVNWHCNEDFNGCGSADTGYAGEIMEAFSRNYMVGGRYLSAAHRQTFLDKIYNDIDVPGVVASKANANTSNDAHNRVVAIGVAQAGTSTTITLAGADARPDNYYVNNLIQLFPVGSGGLQYGTYLSGITASGNAGQTCVLNNFNGGGIGALASVTLTDTNTIANGTPLYVIMPWTNSGAPYTANPTTATASSGTATCSGTATVATTAGRGGAVGVYGLVTGYVAATRVATVATAWAVTPSPGDGYKIYATMALSTLTPRAKGVTATGYNTTWNTPGSADQMHVGDMVEGGNNWGLANGYGDPGFSASYVTAINSDTSLTVTNYYPNHYGGATTVPSISWTLRAWQPGDVGMVWWLKHWIAFQGSQPILYPTRGGDSTAWNPNPAEGGNNSVLTQASMAALAIVTAADDPRAQRLLAQGQSYGFDYLMRHYMNYGAGILHSGSTYSTAVQKGMGELASVMANSFPNYPSQDTGGRWITSAPLFKIFSTLPDLRTQNNVQTVFAPYMTENAEGWMSSNSLLGEYAMLDPSYYFNPSHKNTAYLNYFLKNTAGLNFATTLGPAGNYLDQIGLLYIDPRIPQTSYTGLPRQYAFLESSSAACASLTGWPCPATFAGHAVVSRTGWSSRSDSYLLYESRPFINDHDTPHSGFLQLYKVGSLLNCDCLPSVVPFNGWDMVSNGDMLRFGGTSQDSVIPRPSGSQVYPGMVPIVRWASANHGTWESQYGDQDSKYAYWMSDLSGAYKNPVVYAQRSVAHLKDQAINSGTGEEIIVQYDSADLTGHPTSLDFHVNYAQNGQTVAQQAPAGDVYYYDEGTTTCTGGCANLNTNRTIVSLENNAAADTNPARKYGVISKFFSPGTITVRDDSIDIAVTAVSNANPPVFTAAGHGLVTGNLISIAGATGDWIALNSNQGVVATVTVIDASHFSIPGNSSAYSGSFNGTVTNSYHGWSELRTGIQSVSKGNPIVFTGTSVHLIGSGQILGIFGATGDWAALNSDNGKVVATVIDSSHFSIPGDSSSFSGSFDGAVLTANAAYYTGNGTGSGFGYSHRVSVCGGSTCGASVTKFDSVIVHKVSQDVTSDLTLSATALNPDPNWTGVQTKDKVVLFSRGGVTHSIVTPFLTTHLGVAQYLLAGLNPGTYVVTINGLPVQGNPFTVTANDNSLAFESTGGLVGIFGSVVLGGLPSSTIYGKAASSGNAIVR